jgi:hypothetical protein
LLPLRLRSGCGMPNKEKATTRAFGRLKKA